jgi:DNA repair protein RecO (recombination protein O)
MNGCSDNLDTNSLIANHAFVLHRYPYRETSFIVDFFTQSHGRISVIAKGIRSPKSPLKGLLQPFVPLTVHARGRHALKTLTLAEGSGPPISLMSTQLISGLYMNELLVRLLPKEEVCEYLFSTYYASLQALNEVSLRIFEQTLLKTLGYALPLQLLDPDCCYLFIAEHGFELCYEHEAHKPSFFLGKQLCAIEKEDYSDVATVNAAKRLMRLAFAPLLGNKPLKSRELYKQIRG